MLTKLYQYDSEGNAREWAVEVQGDQYRFVTGIVDGALVESTWTSAKPKNVGRANETTGEQQALAEAQSAWTKKKKAGYSETLEGSGPLYFDPMLAHPYELKRLYGAEFFFVQPKLDGIRCIARADGLWSRKGEPFVAVPHIWEQLKPLFDKYPDLVLDGELYNHDLRHNFNKIVSCVKKKKPNADDLKTNKIVEYHIYDCFIGGKGPGGTDYREAVFHYRNTHLNLIMTDMIKAGQPTSYLKLVWTVRIMADELEKMDEWYAEWLEEGYEGQMVRLNRAYAIGKRTYDLQKRKQFITEEFPIDGYEEGNGNWSGAVKAMRGRLPDGRTFKASRDGPYEENVELLNNFDNYRNGTMTVRFLNWTPDGKPRGGIAIAVYEGERND